MSPDELARELEDLQRFAPPAGDPIALLEHDTRIADLQQENEELKQSILTLEAQFAALSGDHTSQAKHLTRLQSERDSLHRKVRENDAEFRWKEDLWSDAALKENTDRRSKRLQSVSWISLAVASLALAFTAVWIGQKYWSYTHDDHLRMLQQATAERTKAIAFLNEARLTFDRAARLQKQKRRPKPPTTPAAKPAADDQNGTSGDAK